MNHLLYAILVWGAGALLQGCTYGPMRGPTSAGLEIYSKSARQYTASVQLAVPSDEVYTAVQRSIARAAEFTVVTDDPQRYLLEVENGSRRLTFQATPLDNASSMLFIWADAGDSGQSGRDLVLESATQICSELQVECEVKEP